MRCLATSLPFARLWYRDSRCNQQRQVYRRSHDAVIRVFDSAGTLIETHEHAGAFREQNTHLITRSQGRKRRRFASSAVQTLSVLRCNR